MFGLHKALGSAFSLEQGRVHSLKSHSENTARKQLLGLGDCTKASVVPNMFVWKQKSGHITQLLGRLPPFLKS